MNARARQLLDELLHLSAEDRALVAAELNASLDSPEEVEKAWAEEIMRRAEDVRAGRSQGSDGFELLAQLRADLTAQKP